MLITIPLLISSLLGLLSLAVLVLPIWFSLYDGCYRETRLHQLGIRASKRPRDLPYSSQLTNAGLVFLLLKAYFVPDGRDGASSGEVPTRTADRPLPTLTRCMVLGVSPGIFSG